jgi:hypothetical protein
VSNKERYRLSYIEREKDRERWLSNREREIERDKEREKDREI